jgi:V/A-type H+-transporting ATPase subunit I
MEETELDVEEHKGSFSQSLFDGGDIIIRFLSNTISYSRILALLTAHWALLLAFTQLNFLVGGGALGFLMIIVGNVLVLTLELLVVFIHTLRLHFYEWFSKFYAGTGTGFHPFKQNFVYTKVVINGKGKRA